MEKYFTRAKTLIEALPYIKEFNKKTVVVKYGGSSMIDEKMKTSVVEDIVLMKLVGINPVIVHGGGKDIDNMLKLIGKKSNFVDGLRVSDKETVEIAEMVLSGKVNKNIVQLVQNHGINAVGISGKDGNTISVKKMDIKNKLNLGYVGKIESINTNLLLTLIENDFIPVIAPIASDEKGETYNINADHAAAAIAGALKAEKLIYLTDVAGVLTDIEDVSTLITRLDVDTINKNIDLGIISGGMIPKVSCSIEGINSGVKAVHILDGRVEHSLLLEIFTKSGIGTMIV